MPNIPYFSGHLWSALTREERFYCFTLYEHARANPADFARWVSQTAGLDISGEDEWDLGVEVCFYRDILWHRKQTVRDSDYSPKRTFDLCLFGRNTIIIIEVKVFEVFNAKHNVVFEEDKVMIPKLLGKKKVDFNVVLVALASSKYFEKLEQLKDANALRVRKEIT